MVKFKTIISRQSYSGWYLIPTIRLEIWGERSRAVPARCSGGFVAFTFLRFDVCLTWAADK